MIKLLHDISFPNAPLLSVEPSTATSQSDIMFENAS